MLDKLIIFISLIFLLVVILGIIFYTPNSGLLAKNENLLNTRSDLIEIRNMIEKGQYAQAEKLLQSIKNRIQINCNNSTGNLKNYYAVLENDLSKINSSLNSSKSLNQINSVIARIDFRF